MKNKLIQRIKQYAIWIIVAIAGGEGYLIIDEMKQLRRTAEQATEMAGHVTRWMETINKTQGTFIEVSKKAKTECTKVNTQTEEIRKQIEEVNKKIDKVLKRIRL